MTAQSVGQPARHEHPSLARIKERAAQLGFTCLESEWRGYHVAYEFACAAGHHFQRLASSIEIALARGPRWLGQIESGPARNIAEVAKREKVDRSYVSRMINLTALAPDIQAAILNDTLPEAVGLFDLAMNTPLCWAAQRERIAEVVARAGERKTRAIALI
ncbi:hypothetical protein [Ralstonia solanacearum]|uniref:Uncharacterized protein n=1 Tax=Ralstonia solanacearum TaxID=305 RepID=A0AAE3NF44_RALSL|nr:hypothetical protein [Ralstonia solanacearum]MDB0520413.1 hypothetical protein [Ralstonia solanacearum]